MEMLLINYLIIIFFKKRKRHMLRSGTARQRKAMKCKKPMVAANSIHCKKNIYSIYVAGKKMQYSHPIQKNSSNTKIATKLSTNISKHSSLNAHQYSKINLP